MRLTSSEFNERIAIPLGMDPFPDSYPIESAILEALASIAKGLKKADLVDKQNADEIAKLRANLQVAELDRSILNSGLTEIDELAIEAGEEIAAIRRIVERSIGNTSNKGIKKGGE
jgi:hypothetical protein